MKSQEKKRGISTLSSSREFGVIVIGLGVFCLFLWAFFLMGFRWPAHDTSHVFYPWRAFFSDSLRNGVFPLWDFWNTPGFQITFLNSPIWYPIALVFGLLTEFNTQILLAEIVFVSWLSSIGCYLWLRNQQVNFQLALCGAVSWVASGPFVTSVQGMGIFTSIAFLPWVFFGSNLLIEAKNIERRLCGVVLISLAVSLIISGGYLAVGIPLLFFAGMYFVGLSLSKYHDISMICVLTAVAGCLTALLIALPVMDYFQVKSVISELRGKGTGFDPFFGSLPATSAWSTLVANGSYLIGVISGRAEQMYIGGALVLAVPVCLTVVRPSYRDVWFLFLAVFVFFASMGPDAPVASFFVRYVPLMGWFRFHVFWSSAIVFLLITLAIRLIQKLSVSDNSGCGFGKLVLVGILITGLLFGLWYSYRQGVSEISIFSFFEIVQYCVLLGVILLIPIYLFFFQLSFSRKWKISILLVGPVIAVILLFLIPSGYLNIIEQYAHLNDGVFSPVSREIVSYKEKMILGKIGLPSICMFVMDIGQFAVVAGVFCFLVFVILKRNRELFLSCMVLLVVLDMLLGAQRYFHGEPKWLGSPKPSQKIVVSQWTGVLPKVTTTTQSFEYVGIRVPVPVVREDLVEIDIALKANVSNRELNISLSQIGYSNQRLAGTPIRINGEGNIYRVQLKSKYASFSNPTLEVRNYSLENRMQPLSATIIIKRIYHDVGVERKLFADYGVNSRVECDYDTEQFEHHVVPMTETYTPLFNPDIKKLIKDSRTSNLFSKILWVIPGSRELTKENSNSIVEEPVVKKLILKPNELYTRVKLSEPALLLWTDGWHEGWKVTVNGHKADLKQLLGALKGVNLPAGFSDVYFYYSPNYVRYGLCVTILGLIGVFMILFFIINRYRK